MRGSAGVKGPGAALHENCLAHSRNLPLAQHTCAPAGDYSVTMTKAPYIPAATLLAALGFAVVGWLYLSQRGLDLYRTLESPDGRYRVEVWRQPQPFTMPGQSGDAPGLTRLVDASGDMLAEVPVEMVQLVDQVDWSDGHAYIKLVVDWDLSALSPGK